MAGVPRFAAVAAAGHQFLTGGQVTGPPPLTGIRYLTMWKLDLPAAAFIAAITVAYVGGVWRLHRRHPEQRWPAWRAALFLAGVALAVLATQSWVGVYDMVLFWVHMIQHLTLIMFAPVLLIAGRPLTLLRDGSSDRGRQRVDGVLHNRLVTALTTAPVALAAYAGTIVCTHLTGLMDTIMIHPWASQAEHLLYLVVGCMFFLLVVGDEPIRWRPSMPGRMLLLVVSMAVDTFTGIALMQSLAPIHGTARSWGLSPTDDTYLGGAIMWVGGDALMFAIMMFVFQAWASHPQRANLGAWLEQARATTYADRVTAEPRPGEDGQPRAVTAVPATPEDVDDDDHLAAYNSWLRKLNEPHTGGSRADSASP